MKVHDLRAAIADAKQAEAEWLRVQPDGFPLDEDRANEASEAAQELIEALWSVLDAHGWDLPSL